MLLQLLLPAACSTSCMQQSSSCCRVFPALQMRPSFAGTPGGCAGTPGGSRTPARSRGMPAGAASRPRLPARPPGGIHSEPCSPRGAADASLADSCDDLETALPVLSLHDDASSSGGFNAGAASGGGHAADAIRVFVRVRPLSEREQAAGGAAARVCVSVAQERAVVLSDPAKAGQEPFVASFDRVFGPQAGQEEVYEAVGSQMVDNCMAGEPRAVLGCSTDGLAWPSRVGASGW